MNASFFRYSYFLVILNLLFVSAGSANESIKTFVENKKNILPLTKAFYQSRNFTPYLSNGSQWTISLANLDQIKAVMTKHGLNPENYSMSLFRQSVSSGTYKPDQEVQFLEHIQKSMIHISVGRIDPQSVSNDIKFSMRPFLYAQRVMTAPAQDLASIIEQTAPKNFIYTNLISALESLKRIEKNGDWRPTDLPSESLRKGTSHPTVGLIKTKLSLLGYPLKNRDSVYDDELEAYLKLMAAELGTNFDGRITSKSSFWSILNSDIRARIKETELQMEKARWLPENLEDRFAFINLANKKFQLFDKDQSPSSMTLDFKAINGQIKRRTPSMKDKVVSVVLNPTWTVTMNIFFNDKLPLIRKNPDYLKNNGFKVINMKTDEEMDPYSIDWNSVTRSNIDFQLVQNPSYMNALGVVKFPMTNKFNIYLHDTSDRHLFKNTYRHLSSGCVRLEKPLDLAEYLLLNTSWNRSRIESIVAKPGEIIAKDTPIRVSKPLNIYLISLTAALDGQRIQFFGDYYSQNQNLHKKLTQVYTLPN